MFSVYAGNARSSEICCAEIPTDRNIPRPLALAETWSEVWGDEVGALAPKNFFLPSPPKCEIWGDGGGLTVFANYNIQPMDFVYI